MSPDRLDAERLGQQLRDSREARELLLEDVEQALRIRARFLAAFESGDYADLPGMVQARGFLRNYARYLGLDEDDCLSQFDAIRAHGEGPGLGWRRPQRGAVSVAGIPDPLGMAEMGLAGGGVRRRSPLRIVVLAVLGLVIVGGLCVGTISILEQALNDQANQEGLNLLSILPTAPTLTPSSTFNPTSTPLPGQAVASGPLITDRVVLNLTVLQRTFLRVTADGTMLFEGVVTPGTDLPYQADQELILEASNAAGLDVIFNNLPIGLLGARGEAITRTFTPDLILTPTVPPSALRHADGLCPASQRGRGRPGLKRRPRRPAARWSPAARRRCPFPACRPRRRLGANRPPKKVGCLPARSRIASFRRTASSRRARRRWSSSQPRRRCPRTRPSPPIP